MSRLPVANFDSATAMVRALARVLHGRDFPLLGTLPAWSEPVMRAVGGLVNALPSALREQVYIWGGWTEAIAPGKLHAVRVERIAAAMTALYPQRTYPAVAIGSSNGAAIHLFAALGIPWLPQTFLMPVARSAHDPDEPRADMEWGRRWAGDFLEANPDVQLHHMHDPNQDHLMIQRMAYFRLKRRRLGESYTRFLRQALGPSGTVILMDCGVKWPTTRLSDRHVFQFGALGGATADEYHHGSPRVRAYLARYRAAHERWDAPTPDGDSPEAEWGFEDTLAEDVEQLARQHGWRVMRVRFADPEDLSPVVADVHRRWYRDRGLDANRLLVESFILLEPYWALRTGSVPFWMVFNTEPSARALGAYLDESDRFDEIGLMLFSHGVDSVGLVGIDQWRGLLGRARRRGVFLGVDTEAFPRDFAVFTTYHHAVSTMLPERYPLPQPLPLGALDEILAGAARSHGIRASG